MGRLDGKTCVVTGAAQGIGRSAVEAFLREGARVIGADIQFGKLKDVSADARFDPVEWDVTEPAQARAVAARIPEASVLVNCAGSVPDGSVLDTTPDALERCFRLNVFAMAHAIAAFLPQMLERRAGAIINVASVVSTVAAAPRRFAYAASKAAVIGLTKSVACDFAAQGIRCNAISPGTVDSPSLRARMSGAGDAEAARRAFIARQPSGRLGRTEEIAAVMVLLASDEATFMSGANIVIDGGMSL